MIRTITRSAVGGWIGIVRFPFNAVVRLLGDSQLGSRAELALDRFDATARDVAGRTLRDEELVEHGERLRAATGKRERALSLREEAHSRSFRADERIAERERHAKRQRRNAVRRSIERKEHAERERQAENRRLKAVEERRKAAAKKSAAETKASLNHRAKKSRLDQLDDEAGTIAKRERALVAKQEAQRLRRAASKTKAARKSG